MANLITVNGQFFVTYFQLTLYTLLKIRQTQFVTSFTTFPVFLFLLPLLNAKDLEV